MRQAFLAWYTDAEPTFLTGLPENQLPSPFFAEAFEALGGAGCTDPEACFVIGVMAQMLSWCCGNETHWQATGESFIARACALSPHGLAADIFDGRGAYGQYFAHMSAPFKRA